MHWAARVLPGTLAAGGLVVASFKGWREREVRAATDALRTLQRDSDIKIQSKSKHSQLKIESAQNRLKGTHDNWRYQNESARKDLLMVHIISVWTARNMITVYRNRPPGQPGSHVLFEVWFSENEGDAFQGCPVQLFHNVLSLAQVLPSKVPHAYFSNFWSHSIPLHTLN